MKGALRPSSISSYKTGGGRSRRQREVEEAGCSSQPVVRGKGREEARCWEQKLLSRGPSSHTSPIFLPLKSTAQPREREGPMSKSPPLLSPSWYEVDNLPGNKEQRPSQSWGKRREGNLPPLLIHPHPSAHDQPHGYITRLRMGFNTGIVTIATSSSFLGTD